MVAQDEQKTKALSPRSSEWKGERGEWAIRSKHALTPEGDRAAAVVVRSETILAVVGPDEVPAGCPVEDVGERVIMPGLVDTHVHINEPGRTQWEGFTTATRAAAAGGITTLVDMPLNSSPVTTTADALARKLAAAKGKLFVDCGFYGGIVPGNTSHVRPLIEAGVLGFKAFLCHSGIDEFPNATKTDLRAAMPTIAAAGLPLLVHAELIKEDRQGAPNTSDPRSYAGYLISRPRHWEHEAIELLISLCREQRCRVHIVHLSSADALPIIAAARADGLPLTVETCPHYLYFAAEEIPDGDPRFKCAPPIRERANRERLRAGLEGGLIDTIGSDHSPSPPEMKQLASGDLQKAWGGIASLQLTLPILWTLVANRHGVTLLDLAKWMSHTPAHLVGLGDRKGSLSPGHDADLVIFDPTAEFMVTPAMLHHRHKITPYEGRTLRGRVEKTFLRGHKVFDAGSLSDTAAGRALLRAEGLKHD
jgi:allantoinase